MLTALILSTLSSIVANVAGHYICKWLDRR